MHRALSEHVATAFAAQSIDSVQHSMIQSALDVAQRSSSKR